jgi:prepilin-type N-terminal cleavage/methylation domain-containing protein/prepilin-type processing-associated H-X9-DG protein
MKNPPMQHAAFTLVELLVVIGILAILATCSLSALARTKPQAQRIACSNNLKQVGMAFQAWANSHGGNTPMNAFPSGGNGGFTGFGDPQYLYQVFRYMSNELVTPKLLFCPAEMDGWVKYAATTFALTVPPGAPGQIPFTSNTNLSYFLGWDAQETMPQMFLVGDHSIGSGSTTTNTAAVNPYRNKAVALGTNNIAAAWTDSSQHQKQGNICLADGSVKGTSIYGLKFAAANSGDSYHHGIAPPGMNRLIFPGCPDTVSSK